ncbi:hypothetical protein O2K51_12980 [Apibacter raozihei]|uniref:hypothetical protein n=1 Tax=Apibacter raozihei TaxID=2500547 RepID=UPI000FE32A3D|nr:hypothetical protein [Apibacter raozihei]
MENNQITEEKHYYARKFLLFLIITFTILLFTSIFLLNNATFVVSICILNIVIQIIRYNSAVVEIGNDYIKLKKGIFAASRYILFNEITSWHQEGKKIIVNYILNDSSEEKKEFIYTGAMEENVKESLLKDLNKIHTV